MGCTGQKGFDGGRLAAVVMVFRGLNGCCEGAGEVFDGV